MRVLLSLLQSKCFIQKITKGPEPDIPVDDEDSDVGLVILYPHFELKYFLIFQLSIGITLQ